MLSIFIRALFTRSKWSHVCTRRTWTKPFNHCKSVGEISSSSRERNCKIQTEQLTFCFHCIMMSLKYGDICEQVWHRKINATDSKLFGVVNWQKNFLLFDQLLDFIRSFLFIWVLLHVLSLPTSWDRNKCTLHNFSSIAWTSITVYFVILSTKSMEFLFAGSSQWWTKI